MDDKRHYQLVFSDEFNRDGRSFQDGNDPRWTALNKNDLTNNPLHYYSDSNAYTHNGQLVLQSDLNAQTFSVYDPVEHRYHNETKQVRSAMVQSWNKFCFTGGIVEFSAKLPGKPYKGGMWPALWMLGNLARATYVNSTEHMWPFSSNVCDERVEAQEINACQSHSHRGRGAPEVDLMEVMYVSQINASIMSSSLQVAPGLAEDRPVLGQTPNVR
jgi:beta-glucanase (GH16 family)